jgi:GT2 family glycosyltransferase
VTAARVAVVVATHDRPAGLRRLLDALAAQSRPADTVVLVDDGSSPPASQVVESHGADLSITLLRNPAATGPGRARNRGWRAAVSADHVAFTDDDCRPAPRWLESLLAAVAPDRIVVGRVEPDPLDGPVTSILHRSMRVEEDDGRFSTCNVLYPRSLLERVGGFDEEFDLYGEDTDLGQRAVRTGASSCFAPDALVHHAVHRQTVAQALRERRRIGEMARLLRRHPHLRHDFPWADGVWLSHDQRYFVQAVGALLLSRRAPLLGAYGAARWVRYALRVRLQQWPRDHVAQRLALLALFDAVDLASCVEGSIRHRTLVL